MNNKTKGFLLLPLFVFLLAFVTAAVSPRRRYDIVIYGGGSSGFIAAIQAAESGKSVALVEPASRIGGINIEGLGGTDVDNHIEFKNSPAVGGLALSFYRRIAREYGRLEAFDQAL